MLLLPIHKQTMPEYVQRTFITPFARTCSVQLSLVLLQSWSNTSALTPPFLHCPSVVLQPIREYPSIIASLSAFLKCVCTNRRGWRFLYVTYPLWCPPFPLRATLHICASYVNLLLVFFFPVASLLHCPFFTHHSFYVFLGSARCPPKKATALPAKCNPMFAPIVVLNGCHLFQRHLCVLCMLPC